MSALVIGMDPHKRSATIEVMTSDEAVLGRAGMAPDASGYRAMCRAVRRWPERTWAIEECQGIGVGWVAVSQSAGRARFT